MSQIMYDAMTPELIDVLDSVKTLAEQQPAQRRKLGDAALELQRISAGIASQAVKLADPLARQSATTVADGLAAAAQLCRTAMESDS
jgi:ABC-type transporter Mla subunit MlaD